MKLASRRNGRDGDLLVVSRDLTRARLVPGIAQTMQAALDDWERLSPALGEVYEELCEGSLGHHGVDDRPDGNGEFTLDCEGLAAPLPRAYQWLDGSAYVNHVELVRQARGAEMPESFWADPLMYQGGSDILLGPRDPMVGAASDWGLDFEAEVVVFLDDLARGASVAACAEAIVLVGLVNDVSLRGLIPSELAKGFGFIHGKPPTAFSPVAVTPDELGACWRDGKLHRPLRVHRDGELFGEPNAGVDMTFNFPTLIAHAAKTRPLSAGTIIGSGTVSNRDRRAGGCCIAEKRMLETIESGTPKTSFLVEGEVVRIEMLDEEGLSIFGAIEQIVHAPGDAS